MRKKLFVSVILACLFLAAGQTGTAAPGHFDRIDVTDTSASAIDHIHVPDPQLAGYRPVTCVEDGYTGDVICSVCDQVLSAGRAIPAQGHIAADHRTGVKAVTCLEDGYTGDICCEVCHEVLEAGQVIKARGSHDFGEWEAAAEADCTHDGLEKRVCRDCGAAETRTIARLGHTTENVIVSKAKPQKDGLIEKTCTRCGQVISEVTIPRVDSVLLSASSYVYNGTVRNPSVTVYNGDGDKIGASHYTVSYSSGCKAVGSYTVTVRFDSDRYEGTVKESFLIVPKGTSITSLTAGKKSFTVKWAAQKTQTSGYQILYAANSEFKGGTMPSADKSLTSKTIKSLKGNTKYYVKIRTYKKVDGVNYYSKWSKVYTVKTKN